jgi:hypothetical protein
VGQAAEQGQAAWRRAMEAAQARRAVAPRERATVQLAQGARSPEAGLEQEGLVRVASDREASEARLPVEEQRAAPHRAARDLEASPASQREEPGRVASDREASGQALAV